MRSFVWVRIWFVQVVLVIFAGFVYAADPVGWTDDTKPILEPGIAIHSHGNFKDASDGDDMLKLYDASTPEYNGSRPVNNDGTYTHHTWDYGSMGNIFGIAVDRYRNIYTTASANWPSSYYEDFNGSKPQIGYGEIGQGTSTEIGNSSDGDTPVLDNSVKAAGAVYKIDALTGEATLFTSLPQTKTTITNQYCEVYETEPIPPDVVRYNTGPGLGNIAYDKFHDQFFISNFSDGKIYRIDHDGTHLSEFDTRLGGLQRDNKTVKAPYGLAVSPDGTKLYYGTMETNYYPQLFAISLNATGDFNGSAIDQHARLADSENGLTYTQNIAGDVAGSDISATRPGPAWAAYSDISFDPKGEMILGIRIGCAGNFATGHDHGGGVYLLVKDENGHYNKPAPQVPGDGNITYTGVPDTMNDEKHRNGLDRYDKGSIPIRAPDNYTSGGLDSGPDDGYGGVAVWAKADGTYDFFVTSADIEGTYGVHGFMQFPSNFTYNTGINGNHSVKEAEGFKSVPSSTTKVDHIFFPHDNPIDYKGIGGDVEVLSVLPVSIGSVVWEDNNKDGYQDTDEPRVKGATVTLFVKDDDGDFVPARDISGTPVAPFTTLANGQYFFSDLPEGDYKVQVTPPSGYIPTPVQTTADNDDSEKDSNIAHNLSGGVYESGIFTLIADYEPVESTAVDGDGADNTGADTNATKRNDKRGNMTVDFGFFKLIPSIDVEKHTSGADADTAADAYAAQPDENITWTYTIKNTGNETLINISATDEPEGAITCPKTTLAPGEEMECTAKTGKATKSEYENNATVTAEGNISRKDVNDSDSSHYKVIKKGVKDKTIYRIGDLFWIDANNNGTFDGGEKGISGATVELLDENDNKLYWSDDHNSSLTTSVTKWPAKIKTDPSGRYHFDVPGGKYKVRFTIPPKKIDDGYEFVKIRKSGDDTNKVLPNGIVEKYVEVGPDAKEDLTLDAAIYCGCADVTSDSASTINILSFILMILGVIGIELVHDKYVKIGKEGLSRSLGLSGNETNCQKGGRR